MIQQDPSRLSGWLMFKMHCIAWNRNPKFPRNNHKKQRCHTCGYKSQLIKFYNFCTNKFVRVIISCHKTHHGLTPVKVMHCVMLCRRAQWLMSALRDNLFTTEVWVSESQYQSAQPTAALCTARPASSVSAVRVVTCVGGERLTGGEESWELGPRCPCEEKITPPGRGKFQVDNDKNSYIFLIFFLESWF